jgi:hypothetical protein
MVDWDGIEALKLDCVPLAGTRVFDWSVKCMVMLMFMTADEM